MKQTGWFRPATTAAFLAAVLVAAPALAQRERLSLAERVAELESRLGQETDRETLTDLVLRINELQQEVRELRGLVEEQGFELENLKSSQRDQYLDLDRRLSDLAQGGSASSARRSSSGFPADPSPPVTEMSPQDRRTPGPDVASSPVQQNAGGGSDVVPLQGDVPEVRGEIDAELESSGVAQQQQGDVATLVDPAEERSAYNQAFDALKAGRYADSARLFANFVERYPSGEYADNAQYWLGESYYVTGNYRIALDAFQALLNRFPDSPKAPDALLKLGYTYFSLQEWQQAEQVLKEVIQKYPNSTVSRLAENRLRTMRIQGHIQ